MGLLSIQKRGGGLPTPLKPKQAIAQVKEGNTASKNVCYQREMGSQWQVSKEKGAIVVNQTKNHQSKMELLPDVLLKML